MYNHILVPVALDHGTARERAVAVARTLSSPGGRISLLHVMEEIPGYVTTYLPEHTLEKNRADWQADLDALAAQVGEGCTSTVLWGHPSQTILDQAGKHEADCIVIASHKPGLEDYFLGSTAARVVRHAPCSVHVIR